MDCYIWAGAVDKDGYGTITFCGKRVRLHRLAFWWANGEQAGGMVLHKCHNRRCWNPEHLYDGTHVENMKDRRDSGRNRSGQDKYRHLVVKIRELCDSGHKQRAVAKLLGVPKSVVGDVMSGACWSDI